MKPITQGWFNTGGRRVPSTLLDGNLFNYPFNGNVLDATGANNGTAFNITYDIGKISQSAVFNGVNGYVLAKDGIIDNGNTGTIGAWVYSGAIAVNQAIFGCGGDDANELLLFAVSETAGVLYPIVVYREAGNLYLTVQRGHTALPPNTWCYIMLSTDGTQYKMRVNKIPQTLTTAFGAANHGKWLNNFTTANCKTTIGTCVLGGVPQLFFTGRLDEVTYWNRDLLLSESIDMYNDNAGNVYPYVTYTTNRPFSLSVKTDNAGSSTDHQFTLPLKVGLQYSCTIDWGDGNTTQQVDDISPTHTYAAIGTYIVNVTNLFPKVYFNISGDALKVTSLNGWGLNAWSSGNDAFSGCQFMIDNHTDSPDLSQCTTISAMMLNCALYNGSLPNVDAPLLQDMSFAWYNCLAFVGRGLNTWTNATNITTLESTWEGSAVFNTSVNNLGVSNCTTLKRTWYNCFTYNKAIPSWNTSNVTTMSHTWSDCNAHNQPLNHLDTSNVTNMDSVLYHNFVYNKPLSNWDLTGVTTAISAFEGMNMFDQDISSWSTPALIYANFLFFQCYVLNSAITNLDFTNVISSEYCLFNCFAFTQPISHLNMSSNANMDGFMTGKTAADYPAAYLDDFYNALALAPPPAGTLLGMGTIKYTVAGAAARAVLVGAPNNMIIVDGGQTP